MKQFLYEDVAIMVVQSDSIMLFKGRIVDYDDNFIYLDKDHAGMINSAVGIKFVVSVLLADDEPEIVEEDEEKMKEIKEQFKRLKSDDDKDGNLQ